MGRLFLFCFFFVIFLSSKSLGFSAVKEEGNLYQADPLPNDFENLQAVNNVAKGRKFKSSESLRNSYLGSLEHRSQDSFAVHSESRPTELLLSHHNIAGPSVTMIGGQTGSYHETYVEGGNYVSTIEVFAAASCIKAIRMWSTDGTSFTIGDPDERGPWYSMTWTLMPGERITSVTLWGNGIGTRTGWIKISTSDNRLFSYGMLKWKTRKPYPAQVYSGIIIGAAYRTITGNTSGPRDVYAFAFIFAKSIVSAQLQNPTYKSFGNVNLLNLDSGTFTCTNSPCTGWSLGPRNISKTVNSLWTTSSIGIHRVNSVSVTAQVPELTMDEDGSVHWKTERTVQFRGNSDQINIGWNSHGLTALCKTTNVNVTVAEGVSNKVDYQGIIALSFTDGAQYSYPISGVYEGLTYSNAVTHQSAINSTC